MLDPMKILMEACECAECDEDCLDAADAEEELYEEYDDIEEYPEEDDPTYTEEMVPVFAVEENSYIVESDMLAKYMNSSKIYDPKDAICKIAESNGISANDIAVLIESNDYALELIEEVKQLKNKDKIKKASAMAKFLKNFKLKGIKVVKKKAKK